MLDATDECPSVTNQADRNRHGVGDACDPRDGDSLSHAGISRTATEFLTHFAA
jgi:hypothetical protein